MWPLCRGQLVDVTGSMGLVTAMDLVQLWHCESSHRKLVRKRAWLSAENIMDKASQPVASGP